MANLNANKAAQRAETVATDAAALMQPLAQPLADAVAECGEACSKGMAQWQDEVARFAQARLQRNSELAEALTHTRDLNAVVGLQQEWLKTASQDYVQQTARMMGLASRMTQDWMQPMTRLWGNGAALMGEPKLKG